MTEHEDTVVPRILRGFTTRAVHAGERPERPEFTPTVTPIYPSVSYLADDPETQDAVFGGAQQGYVYTRHGNPTTRALFDERTGVLWSVDTFATNMPVPLQESEDLSDDAFAEGQMLGGRLVSWIAFQSIGSEEPSSSPAPR